jgi:hypothetical protein
LSDVLVQNRGLTDARRLESAESPYLQCLSDKG